MPNIFFHLNESLEQFALENASPSTVLHRLILQGCDLLPLPAAGNTLERWRCLARVAAHDLSLAKLYEGHTDALAILAEMNAASGILSGPKTSWGVWAADPPQARVVISGADHQPLHHLSSVRLSGVKAWCSGAAELSHALVTVRDAAGQGYLAAVNLSGPGIEMHRQAWKAIGMAGSASIDVHFNDTPAQLIGAVDDYLTRPGFWHGGAGVAACWYGAAAAIGERMRSDLARPADPYFMAHLGAIDVALRAAKAQLIQVAAELDAAPDQPALGSVMQFRLQVEKAATDVINHAGRALGAAPYCRDAWFARMMADLPVFIRQSHAERDLAFLGQQVLKEATTPWTL